MPGLPVSIPKKIVYIHVYAVHRDNKTKNPTAHIQTYSLTTTSGTLRAHLAKYHREEYDKKCAENGWKNSLVETEKQKEVMAEVVNRSADREPFSTEGLLKRIVRFIVADDQVIIFQRFQLPLSNNSYSLSGFRNAQNSVNCSFLLVERSTILT